VPRDCLCSRFRLDVVSTHSDVELLAFSLSSSWSVPPSLLEGVSMAFLAGVWSGRLGSCSTAGFFFVCYGWWWWWCGGAEGIGGMGRHSHRRPGLHSSHTTFHRGWNIVFTTVSKHCDDRCKTFLPQDVFSRNHPCMTTRPSLKIESTRKIGKHVFVKNSYGFVAPPVALGLGLLYVYPRNPVCVSRFRSSCFSV
jgi:hypothetical protein